MATLKDWIAGIRVPTLPVSAAPVVAGTGIAVWAGSVHWGKALLCLAVALTLHIGENLSNDYSDGARGTDAERVGPESLIMNGKASPRAVLTAAIVFYAIGSALGIWLVSMTGQWWLLIPGILALLAAWFYVGGPHPYGYIGLGEVAVFLFFGLLATAGTVYVQVGGVPASGWIAAVCMGLLACALFVVDSIRDIPTDKVAGKRTIAVRIGGRRARNVYLLMFVAAFIGAIALSWFLRPFVWLFIFYVPSLVLCLRLARDVCGIGRPPADEEGLVPARQNTALAEILFGLAIFASYAVAYLLL
ncbi:1,4-dihydroxy-2-naphthoate prenyltransferase [Actinobaculum suis]|uniref:1,4-dihydroxy-2-naphthoate polyprenyltransferase n=1 Tax=Actinobaculum suis TaxID=1657 RepID=UPI00066FCC57|nr:1,4-dihydroxy-2-naphthoate polyprenyltransferase [Actinobaculum suis]KMY23106.1 1,4-dihydroxy-2-naphthoate prenyltransferase [Actinobaculum suis]